MSEHEHDSGMGHSHNLDPSVFASSAATNDPIGLIMTLHITFMVAGTLNFLLNFICNPFII